MTNLVITTQYTSENINANIEIDIIYTYFSRVCEKIDYSRPVANLPTVGFGFRKPLEPYLLEQSRFVQLGSSCSDEAHGSSRMLHGSVIGPLLFNI